MRTRSPGTQGPPGSRLRTALAATLVIAGFCLIAVLLLVVTPVRHHLGSHEPSLCHPVVPAVFHSGDARFHNERLSSWTREQCALARRERVVTALVVIVLVAVPVGVGVGGLLVRRRRGLPDSAPGGRAS